MEEFRLGGEESWNAWTGQNRMMDDFTNPSALQPLFSDGLRSLFHWILQAPLLADAVHDSHDAEGFIQRHNGAFRLAFSQLAVDFLDLVVETVAFERAISGLLLTISFERSSGGGVKRWMDYDAAIRAVDSGLVVCLGADG